MTAKNVDFATTAVAALPFFFSVLAIAGAPVPEEFHQVLVDLVVVTIGYFTAKQF